MDLLQALPGCRHLTCAPSSAPHLWGLKRPHTASVSQRCKDRREPRRDKRAWVNSLVEKRPSRASRCLRTPSCPTCCQKVFSFVLVISLSGISLFLISAVHLGRVLLVRTLINIWGGLQCFCHGFSDSGCLALASCLPHQPNPTMLSPTWDLQGGYVPSRPGSGLFHRLWTWHVCSLIILRFCSFLKIHDSINSIFFMSRICLRTCFWVNSMSLVNLNLTRDTMLAKLGLTSDIWCAHSIGHTHLMNVRVLRISGSSSLRGYI